MVAVTAVAAVASVAGVTASVTGVRIVLRVLVSGGIEMLSVLAHAAKIYPPGVSRKGVGANLGLG